MIRVEVSKRDWRIQPPYLHEPYASTVRRSPRRPLVPLAAVALGAHRPGVQCRQRAPGRCGSDARPRRGRRSASASASTSPGGSSRRKGGRSPTRWWKCGRRMPPAAIFTRPINHEAPLDPNFTGGGRCMTNARGEYRFTTIHPGAYPWRNHPNAWRPAHIHFSLFGTAFISRLVTQMYFPGDPLLPLDPVLGGVPEEGAAAARRALRPRRHRARHRARLPLRHRPARPQPDADGDALMVERRQTPSQTVGPFFGVGLTQGVAVAERDGERAHRRGAHPHRGNGLRWRRRADRGCARRGLAGQRARPLPPRPRCRPRAARSELLRVWPLSDRRQRRVSLRDRQARRDSRRRRQARTPRTSTSPCSRAACSCTRSRGCISTAMRSTPIRRWRWSIASGAARSSASGQGRVSRAVYRWDIHLQGDRETVFFDA